MNSTSLRSFKVTIRASLTAKTPALQTSPDRFGIIVGTEAASSNQQTKPTVGASRAKANISAAGKAKMTPSKKQTGRTTKHNLALKNVRLSTSFSHSRKRWQTEFQKLLKKRKEGGGWNLSCFYVENCPSKSPACPQSQQTKPLLGISDSPGVD